MHIIICCRCSEKSNPHEINIRYCQLYKREGWKIRRENVQSNAAGIITHKRVTSYVFKSSKKEGD